jgi:DNA-binding PadR family transcriptional regulator
MTVRPLQEPTFLILTALAESPKHGYAVLRDVESLSNGRVVLRPGTLYTALDRLSDEGLIELDREEVTDGRLRRYYKITATGATRLANDAERMRRNATAAIRSLKLGGLGA